MMKKNKTVHYENGCIRSHENYRGFYKIITTIVFDEVTCGKCLDKINRLGLKERKDFPDMPTFEAKSNGWNWFFTCPVCGRKNTHGPGSGHRVSHCGCWWEAGYILTPAGSDETINERVNQ